MRPNAFTFCLLALTLVADATSFCPSAKASTRHAKTSERAHPVTATRKAAVREPVKRAAREETRRSAKTVPVKQTTRRHGREVEVRERKVERVSSRHAARTEVARGRVAQVRVEARPKAVVREQETAVTAPEAPPEVHVKHDRKQHFAAGSDAGSGTGTGIGSGSDQPETGVAHPEALEDDADAITSVDSPSINVSLVRVLGTTSPLTNAASAPAAKPVGVVNVVRPTAQRPQLPDMTELATTPLILPSLYNKRGRLMMPPPMKGSHEILLRQNEVADREGLDRVQDDDDLSRMREAKYLVAIPVNVMLVTDERLPTNRRYVRPWTAQFLSAMARAHYAEFHTPLQVNSAVRTVEFQQHLLHVNGNAAPAGGDTASPHLTGQAVDLAKRGLSMTEIAWMRGYLLPLVQQGKVDVEEEFMQSCFHISVYKSYLPPGDSPRSVPGRRRANTALATAVR